MACLLPSVIIFGVEHKNPDWMPYPTLNWASWSYGLAILSTFLSLFVMLAFSFTWRESKRTLETAGYEFPMSAIIKKSEKERILEEQEKNITAAGLEPINRQLEINENQNVGNTRKLADEELPNVQNRKFRDPRFNGVIMD